MIQSKHYVLDPTFSEDSSRVRKGNGSEITFVFRRLALNMLQRDTTIKESIRDKHKTCGWSEDAFAKLIACFSENYPSIALYRAPCAQRLIQLSAGTR